MDKPSTLHRAVEELEAIVARGEDNPAALASVCRELSSPATPRARHLLQRASDMLEQARSAERKRGRFGLRKLTRKTSSEPAPPPPEAPRDPLEAAFEARRLRLLKLENDHPLLNFRHSERAATHLRLIHHAPDVLMSALRGGAALRFEPLPVSEGRPEDESDDDFLLTLAETRASDPAYLKEAARLDSEAGGPDEEWRLECELRDRVRRSMGLPDCPSPTPKSLTAYAEAQGLLPRYELPESANAEADGGTPETARTLLFPDSLEHRIFTLTAVEERMRAEHGASTLFAAFGFLEWRESERAYRKMLAPLLLYPVRVERRDVADGGGDVLRGTGAPTRVNPILRDRLAHDFGIELPSFTSDDTPEAYLARMNEKVCRNRGRWKVRRFVTVGLFDTGHSALFNELDPAHWPAARPPHTHRVIAGLLGEGAGTPATTGEAETASPSPIPVVDADSGQVSAMRRVRAGESIAVTGAPGTGKSQTIANLIADATAQGKRTLVVANKSAALDTVKARLDGLGLGACILPLHGAHSRPAAIRRALATQAEPAPDAPSEPEVAALRDEVDELERRLVRNAELLSATFGNLGKTIAELFWSEIRTREHTGLPDSIEHTDLPGAADVAPEGMTQAKAALRTLEQNGRVFIDDYGGIDNHPWHGVDEPSLSDGDLDRLRSMVAAWCAALRNLHGTASALPGPADTIPAVADARRFAAAVETLPGPEEPADTAVFAALRDDERLNAAETLHADLRQHAERIETLSADTTEPYALDGHAAELEAAAEEAARLDVAATPCSDLADVTADFRTQAEHWRRMVAAAKRLMRLAELPGEATPALVSPLLAAARRARDAETRTLRLRLRALADPDVQAELARGRKEKAALDARVEELGTTFHIPADAPEEAEKLRAHAAALTQERFLMNLRPSVRRAKRRYKALVREKGAHKKVERGRMAADMETVATLVADLHGFRQDATLCRILGGHFAGVDTDFDGLDDATAFVCAAIEAFPGHTPEQYATRHLLIEGNLDTLQEIAKLAGDEDIHRLSAALEGLTSYPNVRLDGFIGKLDTRADDIEALERQITALAIRAHVHPRDLPRTAERVRACEDVRARIDDNATAREALGPAFQGVHTDTAMLGAAIAAARTVKTSGLPDILVEHLFAVDYPDRLARFREAAGVIRNNCGEVDSAIADVEAMQCLDLRAFVAGDPETAPFPGLIARLQRAEAHGDALTAWRDYQHALRDVRELGAGPVLDAYDADNRDYEDLDAAYERQLFRALTTQIYETYPELREMQGRQAEMRGRYRDGLARLREMQAERLRAELASRDSSSLTSDPVLAATGDGENGTGVDSTGALPELSVPRLLSRLGGAIQAAKPCVMASPRALAELAPPGSVQFDLVILDEASGISPEMALGSIARAPQAVIIGDAAAPTPGGTKDTLLGLAQRQGFPLVRLSTYYRDARSGLFALAGRAFHDDGPTVFAGPDDTVQEPPLTSRMIVTGCYLAGMNVQEAQKVAEAGIDMLKQDTRRSLGVVAASEAQADVIRDIMDRLAAMDPAAAARLSDTRERGDGPEPVFVKPLQDIQGDVRDVILFSATYGLDIESGRLAGLDGPLTESGGERFIPALLGAARQNLHIVTSMHPSDLDNPGTAGAGLRALQELLALAAEPPAGALSARSLERNEPARMLRQEMEARGFAVDSNVGVNGHHLDLAVRSPANPKAYLLGIEFDGTGYRAAPAVRDSDAMWPAAMERLGWRVVRIWSSDWQADFEAELEALESHLQELAADVPPMTGTASATPVTVAASTDTSAGEAETAEPVRQARSAGE
ncbi:DUF4011 domain-containing protein [Ferruginivarius sediminum]|uniref:DUF4011 domain-containing protein n=1 Tax=Ferruginivarius sediminum TaxID=2661937 RepID=A0A369TF50_9PROT|nr:DUF4011 domain-containing protein [Ferruginivarius sediminum]RDD63005.1 DUF4011 domain-containing protein [Ferruginivarius sediminum]